MSLQRSELVNVLEITDFVSLFFSKACISIDSFVRTCAIVADTLTAGQVAPPAKAVSTSEVEDQIFISHFDLNSCKAFYTREKPPTVKLNAFRCLPCDLHL